jgi:Flp pilus assembly pilin Flp
MGGRARRRLSSQTSTAGDLSTVARHGQRASRGHGWLRGVEAAEGPKAGPVTAAREVAHMIRKLRRLVRDDAGMTTAEYAVGTIAAVAFAAVLYKVVQSGVVQSALTAIIQSALHTL